MAQCSKILFFNLLISFVLLTFPALADGVGHKNNATPEPPLQAAAEQEDHEVMDGGRDDDRGPDHEGSGAENSGSSTNNRLARIIDTLRGATLYRENCLACHGPDGSGKGEKASSPDHPVPNFTVPQAVARYTLEGMQSFLKAGHKVDTSGEWTASMSDREFKYIAMYIQDAFMLPAYTADSSIGRKIYARTCSVCHGDAGNSASWAQSSLDPPPFDFKSYKAKKLSQRHMINTVTFGSDHTAMVGWATQLSREEITAVVDYIRADFIFPKSRDQISLSGRNDADIPVSGKLDDAGKDGKIDMHSPFMNGLSGNFVHGKELYEENCVPCHAKKGDGNGPRAYFIFPRPENFTGRRAKNELNRPHILNSVTSGINGTVMPSWGNVLNEQQITDITEYVFSSFVVQVGATEQPVKAHKVKDRAPGKAIDEEAPTHDEHQNHEKKNES